MIASVWRRMIARPAAGMRARRQVGDPARDRPRLAGIRDQDADVDALGDELADPDLVQRFLQDAVQGLAGEPGEVDRYLGLLERLLDMRAQRDSPGGALADEHAAALAGHDQPIVAQHAGWPAARSSGHAVAGRQLGA